MSMLKEYPTLTQVKTTSASKYLVCKVYPDSRFKTGSQKMSENTGVEFWKGNKRKDWENYSKEWTKKRKKKSKGAREQNTMKMEWRKRKTKNHNKISISLSNSVSPKTDDSYFVFSLFKLIVLTVFPKNSLWFLSYQMTIVFIAYYHLVMFVSWQVIHIKLYITNKSRGKLRPNAQKLKFKTYQPF